MRRALDFVVLVAALASVPTAAQRPDNTSICDFYATKQYGTNSSESQFKLMQRIVSFAFAGGAGLPGASESSTGILNPGVFQGRSVNLRSWFDGSSRTHPLAELVAFADDRSIRSNNQSQQPTRSHQLARCRWRTAAARLPERQHRHPQNI